MFDVSGYLIMLAGRTVELGRAGPSWAGRLGAAGPMMCCVIVYVWVWMDERGPARGVGYGVSFTPSDLARAWRYGTARWFYHLNRASLVGTRLRYTVQLSGTIGSSLRIRF